MPKEIAVFAIHGMGECVMSKVIFVAMFVVLFGQCMVATAEAPALQPSPTQTAEPVSELENKAPPAPANEEGTPQNKTTDKGGWWLFFKFIGGETASITKLGAFIVAILLVFAGFKITHIKAGDPLESHVFELVAITFILPVLLMVGILTNQGQEAVIGILGTIVGYVFGTQKARRAGDTGRGASGKQSSELDIPSSPNDASSTP